MSIKMNKSIIKIISALEEKHSEGNPYQSLTDISLSEEELKLIEKRTDIFFMASKARVLLVHWICESIRNVYEQVNFEAIDISNETYEALRKDFNTKAFKKSKLLELFNCSKNHYMPYEDFVKYEQKYISAYNEIVPEDAQLSTITHIFVPKKDKAVNFHKEIKDIIKKERQEKILYARAKGMTLDAVGKLYKITRERARQIEIKPKALIERWMEKRHQDIIDSLDREILINNIAAGKLFGEKYWSILKYAAMDHKNKVSNWHYIEELDTIIYSDDNRLYSDISDALSAAAKKNASAESVVIKLNNMGYDYISIEHIKEFCKNSQTFYLYDDKVYDHKLNVGKSILIAAETKYKDGIDIGSQEKIEEFAKYINDTYGLNVKANRALTARIQDVLIMSDKTVYKSPKFIKITDDLNALITNKVNSLSSDRTTYQLLYESLPQDVLKNNGIMNYSGLHGYIKKHEEELGIISLRYYVCKADTQELLSKGFFQEFVEWTKKVGRPVSFNEVTDKFKGWTGMYPKYAMLYFPEIVQWKKDTYINLDIIKISDANVAIMERLLDKCLNNDIKYTNSYIVSKELKALLPEFFQENDITEDSQVFHILKYYFRNSNKYFFAKPHIVSSKHGFDEFTTETLINLIIGKGDSVLKSKITDGIKKYYGEKNSSLALALQKVLSDFIRIDSNQYFRKSKLRFSKNDIAEIEEYVESLFGGKKYIIPENITNFSLLPKAPFKWNSWSLCEVVRIYLPDKYNVLNKRSNIIQNTMVIVRTEDGFDSKESLVDYLLINEYTGSHKINDVEKYIKDLGLYSNSFQIENIRGGIHFEFY